MRFESVGLDAVGPRVKSGFAQQHDTRQRKRSGRWAAIR
jgi:hypothetical protein